jgi:hypothetical protein
MFKIYNLAKYKKFIMLSSTFGFSNIDNFFFIFSS